MGQFLWILRQKGNKAYTCIILVYIFFFTSCDYILKAFNVYEFAPSLVPHFLFQEKKGQMLLNELNRVF